MVNSMIFGASREVLRRGCGHDLFCLVLRGFEELRLSLSVCFNGLNRVTIHLCYCR